ncbi:MAG: hypothetical protein K2L44_00135 [Duncaniella sp.]|nr:hypothetical protein [Duncaniella sp.]
MKKLPVSRKVYADISERINTSLSHAPQSAAEAMRIVEAYLDGTTAESSDPMALLAFNMIKVELDRAMLRSARARQRAQERKNAPAGPKKLTPEEIVEKLLSQLTPEDFEDVTPPTPPLPPTRRERREAARARKQRWKSLTQRP